MKTAIIYYSYEGNSALAAKVIADALGGSGILAELFEIKTADAKQRSGFIKYAWGVVQVLTRKKPPILPLTIDINAFDLIILGTPVWASSPAPAMVSFLSKERISGKKIALFCCHAGSKENVFDKFKALLPGNTVTGEIDFINPAREDNAALKEKIENWARGIGGK